ncbi:MAG: hypothetical protein HJJLKODD_01638 [Phycisphaerae bacterium]|nr:hypothetical protein [Phycisphaerae bacterium]
MKPVDAPQPPHPAPRRRRWLMVLIMLGLLLCGGLLGSAVTLVVVAKRVQTVLQHPEEIPRLAAARLRRHLELTEDQTRQLEAILSRHQERVRQIRERFRPRIVERFDELRLEVDELLNPQQQDKWHNWLELQRRLWLPPVSPTSSQPDQ